MCTRRPAIKKTAKLFVIIYLCYTIHDGDIIDSKLYIICTIYRRRNIENRSGNTKIDHVLVTCQLIQTISPFGAIITTSKTLVMCPCNR